MTEGELTKFLEENADAIKEASRAAIIEKIQDTLKWSLPDTISNEIQAFFKKEIAPEVAKYLADQKGPILEAAKQSAVELSEALSKEMLKRCAENMNGYRAEQVMKALLGIDSRY